MAPEAYLHYMNKFTPTEVKITGKVDVFAFGVILWELLTNCVDCLDMDM